MSSSFPRVNVESLQVHTPPYNKPGVVQEFVGEGVTKELPEIPRGDSFSTERVENFVDEAREMIGLSSGEYQIKYTLLIRGVTKRGAKATARSFVRVKNSFETDMITVTEPELDGRLSSEKLGKVYRVTASVEK